METKVLKLNTDECTEHIGQAAEIIKRGGLVVFPTETVYGLGADATNPHAAQKIYAAKGRPSDNPLIIHIANPCDAEKYAHTSELYYKLAAQFMPGPLTVVLPKRDIIPKETTGGLDTVAVRCPEHKIARMLIESAGVPIAAPSANISGSPSPTSASHAIDDMMGRVDMILDGGDCEIGLESTIIKVDSDKVVLLRPGKITPDMLSSVVGEVEISSAVTDKLKMGERVVSPGMKYRHYAPKSPLTLISGDFSEICRYISSKNEEKLGIIAYSEYETRYREKFPNADIYTLGAQNDESTQARKLFSVLRQCDKKSYGMIYAPIPNSRGMGLALYNRMIRAAAYQIIKL